MYKIYKLFTVVGAQVYHVKVARIFGGGTFWWVAIPLHLLLVSFVE